MLVTSHQGMDATSILRGRTNRRKKKQLLEPSEIRPCLQIESVPEGERVDPKQNSYVLVVQPHNIRACGGQYTADEAYQIAKATRNWDFSLDENQRPRCLPQLVRLLDGIIKRTHQQGKGGEV